MKNPELIRNLQNLKIDELFKLTRGMSGIDISQPIDLSDIIFRKTRRSIEYVTSEDLPFIMNHTLEAFDCYAYKSTHTLLGIFLFELLFSDQSYMELKIQNQRSDFKQLFVYVDRENRPAFKHLLEIENKETYKSFEYYPQEVGKFPLSQFYQNPRSVVSKDDLVTFLFGCSDDRYTFSKEFIEKSDQLVISTTTNGLIQFAELLLDIGIHRNQIDEICLENPIYGFGGVSEKSIEARLWLPNSLGFKTEKLEDL